MTLTTGLDMGPWDVRLGDRITLGNGQTYRVEAYGSHEATDEDIRLLEARPGDRIVTVTLVPVRERKR